MQWQDVCEHPNLQNLPFKIELNERGQILMSPVKVYHSAFQGRIVRLLPDNGVVLAECAIKTSKGTKVADVAWASRQRFKLIQHETECSIAPEICIEVASASNTDGEMQEKRLLYIESGALEFWVCNEPGNMTFFDAHGALIHSSLVPDFPKTFEIVD
ncbi:Uma2 family endonuclease [uncultured Thiocystis sp.]|jgi:Uma2 family endonuclease|uniref:Uma2 family endonuclease n=1 Tax=uncultured Thiocystis sp. TaxID=1202134 RepID=UPI0025CF60C6|nr:Uma2 family endonuclease [uncultured Thiocystis sp.]